MRVKVHARLQPPRNGDVDQAFHPSPLSNSFLASVLGPDKRNPDVYRTIAISGDLVNKFLSGFNATLIVLGESGSGKSHTLGLERRTLEDGFLYSIFSDLFGTMRGRTGRFEVSMTELYSETFRDLLRSQTVQTSDVVDVEEDAVRGPWMRNLTRVPVDSRDQCRDLCLEGLERRRDEEREFGSVRNFTTLIVMIHMSQLGLSSTFTVFCLAGAERLVASSDALRLREGPHLSNAILKFERLVTDLAESMSTTPRQVVQYDGSKLTQLLVDALGGNSVTHVLCTFKPESSPAADTVMRIAQHIAQIENFPIENTEDAKSLMAQYRSAVQYYKTERASREPVAVYGDDRGDTQRPIGTSQFAAKDHSLQLERDIVKLRERNMRLEVNVSKLKQQHDATMQEKAKVSSELVGSEEEKLKLAQTLIDMQLDRNQSDKETIEQRHQLETEILQLKDEIEVLREDVKRAAQRAENAEMQHQEIDVNHQELRDEHIALNANYVNLRQELQDEQKKNEELGMEVINLVNTKAALMDQNHQYKSEADKLKAQQDSLTSQALASEQHGHSVDREVEELRAAMNRSMSEALAAKMDMVQKVTVLEGEKRELEKQLLDISRSQNTDISVLKSQYDEDIRRRDEQCRSIQAEILDVKKSLRKTKQKLEKTSDELLGVSSAKAGIEAENTHLESRLTHLMEEFRQRLERYIHDLTKFVSGLRGHYDANTESSLKHFVEAMFRDIRATHESRARELEKQNQSLKQSMTEVGQRHEQLRGAYRSLQGTLSDMGVDLSAEETEFGLPSDALLKPSEVVDSHQLWSALQKAEMDLSAAKEQSLAVAEHHRSVVNQMQLEMVRILEQSRGELDRKLAMSASSKDRQIVEQQKTINELQTALASAETCHQAEVSLSHLQGPGSSAGAVKHDQRWNDLRRQLTEFTMATQYDLEMDRSRLKTHLAIAVEELARYKEFVSDRLTRLYLEKGASGAVVAEGGQFAATALR